MNYPKIVYTGFIDSIFPKTCPVCKEIIMPKGNAVCRNCLTKFNFVKEPTCELCGKEILTKSQRLCYDCKHNSKAFTKGIALLNYDEVAKECMAGIKFLNRKEDIELFASLMALKLGETVKKWDPEFLIPVPVYKTRLVKRGYNQAQVLADCLGKLLNIPVKSDILIRKKQTKAQKNLSREERLLNLEEAFETVNCPQTTRCAVLVDDIYTTGATAEACTRVLNAAGIKDLRVLCICIGSEI